MALNINSLRNLAGGGIITPGMRDHVAGADDIAAVGAIVNGSPLGVAEILTLFTHNVCRNDALTLQNILTNTNVDPVTGVAINEDVRVLRGLVDSALIRADQARVNTIIDKNNFDATVAEDLAVDAAGLAAIRGIPAGTAVGVLQEIVGSARVRADQATVDAIIGMNNFDAAVAEDLAVDAAGLAAIRGIPAATAVGVLQEIVGSARVRADQATVDAIIGMNNFDAAVAEDLAVDAAGLAAIRGIPAATAVGVLQEIANSARVQNDQPTVQAILLKNNLDTNVVQSLMNNRVVLAKAIHNEVGLNNLMLRNILGFASVAADTQASASTIVAIGTHVNLTNAEDAALTGAINACLVNLTKFQLQQLNDSLVANGICAGAQAAIAIVFANTPIVVGNTSVNNLVQTVAAHPNLQAEINAVGTLEEALFVSAKALTPAYHSAQHHQPVLNQVAALPATEQKKVVVNLAKLRGWC